MGLFLVLASDYRIGTDGDYKYQANEVANGLTVPRCALALCRHRIDRAHLTRVVVLAEPFGPKDARDAGLIDRVVPAGELISEALTVAGQAAALDMKAYSATKRRLRRSALGAMRRGRRRDMADFTAIGLKRMVQPPARSH
jgi:enoyl-CoA hydratase